MDKAMAKIPFFVHITTNPSEMTQFADIVLPAAHHATEKLSIIKGMGEPPCPFVNPAACGEADVGCQGG